MPAIIEPMTFARVTLPLAPKGAQPVVTSDNLNITAEVILFEDAQGNFTFEVPELIRIPSPGDGQTPVRWNLCWKFLAGNDVRIDCFEIQWKCVAPPSEDISLGIPILDLDESQVNATIDFDAMVGVTDISYDLVIFPSVSSVPVRASRVQGHHPIFKDPTIVVNPDPIGSN